MGKGIGELRIVGSNPTNKKVFFYVSSVFVSPYLWGFTNQDPPLPPFFFTDSINLIFLSTFGYIKIPFSNATTFRGIRLHQKSNPWILWQVSMVICRICGRNPQDPWQKSVDSAADFH